MTDSDRGPYMHTASGFKYWPLNPHPDDVRLSDIAHHLANKCRYAGAVQHRSDPKRIFYSVAEHSVHVAHDLMKQGAPIEIVMQGLLHDASEAYNGDLIRPLKYATEFAAPFRVVEERNERVVCKRFGIAYPFDPLVKASDEAVTAAEVAQIVPKALDEEFESGKLHDDSRVADCTILMLDPFEARELFLGAYNLISDRIVDLKLGRLKAVFNQVRSPVQVAP